jgi:hypothetical protein
LALNARSFLFFTAFFEVGMTDIRRNGAAVRS